MGRKHVSGSVPKGRNIGWDFQEDGLKDRFEDLIFGIIDKQVDTVYCIPFVEFTITITSRVRQIMSILGGEYLIVYVSVDEVIKLASDTPLNVELYVTLYTYLIKNFD